jgi:hypothetical protein
MNKTELAAARAALLKTQIELLGLTEVARRANKPVRQINDMAAGRKSFGHAISMEIGPLIRPDLGSDWLLYPAGRDSAATEFVASEPPTQTYVQLPVAKGPRELRIDEIIKLLHTTDMDGLAVVLYETSKIAAQYPLVRKTHKSSR